MNQTEAIAKLCVALDVPDSKTALDLAATLQGHVGFVKVGLELYCAEGPTIVTALAKLGVKIFLDLKFHDIPNTVAAVSRVVASLGVDILNLHASGGPEMMKACLDAVTDAAAKARVPRPRLIAVTVLTSIDDAGFRHLSQNDNVTVRQQVSHLARMALASGLDGVVASPQEIEAIRSVCGPEFLIVTPGVRSVGGLVGDQKRVATPFGAITAGADILVIGRPITAAKDPLEAAKAILREIEGL